MKTDDSIELREKLKERKESPAVFKESIKHGAKTAWDVFNLQARDMKQGYKEGIIESGFKRAGIDKNSEYKTEEFYRTKNYEETEKVMQRFVENELRNRQEYEKFYESLGDNQFAKISSSLIYGGSATILNPIELSKNIAINAGVNALLPGAGLGLTFSGNMLADTIDNYYSNTWEDELLGIEREEKEKIINAASGALVSNAVFPAIKFGAKKILDVAKNIDVGTNGKIKFKDKEINLQYKTSVSDNNGELKGVTLREDILEPEIAKTYKAELEKVSAVDLRYEDKDIHQSVIREMVEKAETEEDTVRVHTKQIIKEGITEENTGVKPTILDYKAFIKDYIKQSKKIGNDAAKLYNDNKGEGILKSNFKSIEDAAMSFKFKHGIEGKARDYIQTYLVNPIIITEEGYKNNMVKHIKKMNPKYSNSIEMGLKNQGYYDVLGDDLEDGIVASSISEVIKDNIGGIWNLKNSEGYDISIFKEYGYNLENQFKMSVGNAVSFETLDADLLRTNPKFAKYFPNSNNFEIFTQTMKSIADDYHSKKINKTELGVLLLDMETKFKHTTFTSEKTDINYDFYDILKGHFKEKTFKKLKHNLDELRNNRTNVAMIKLILNKPEMLSDFRTTDTSKLIEKLGDRIYNLEGIKSPEDFTFEFKKKLSEGLSDTTKDVNEIKNDLSEVINGKPNIEKYDLMNFIDKYFVGDNRKEKIASFLDFSNIYFRDNVDMLNLMTNITIQDKASMSALGLPFYEIQSIIKNKGSFLNFLSKVPAFREAMINNDIEIEDFNHQGHKIMDDIMIKYFSEYVNSRAVFEKKQDELIGGVVDGVIRISRDTLLMGSGIKEIFLHPLASAINGVKYGGVGFVEGVKGVALTPFITAKTIFNSLEPLASLSTTTNKIHSKIANLIDGDYSKEIALMETMNYSDILLGKGESGAFKKGYNIYSKMAMGVQEFQQHNRAIASRIFAINKVKKALKLNKFDDMRIDLKKFFISVGIDNDVKFKEWKTKLNNEENTLKAFYQKGYSDETKYILQGIFRNLYEEDPKKHIREKTKLGDTLSKVSMMFTTFQRSQLNRIGDALKYAHLNDGSYIHRWHKEAMFKNFIDGVNIGLPAFLMYGVFGIYGSYIQSKVLGDSQDERIKALVKSAKIGNTNAMKSLIEMASEYAIPYGGMFSRYSDTAISSVAKRTWQGITEDKIKLLPNNAELLYNKHFGERKYKKYKDMDKQTKFIYDGLVVADKINNANSKGLFDYVMSSIITDELVEEGEISKAEALKIKRENGFNDEEIVENLYKRGLDTVMNYANIKSENEEEIVNNIAQGIEIISQDKLSEQEIIQSLDDKNNVYHDMKEYKKEEGKLKFTEEEKKQLSIYENELKEKGYDSFEILEMKLLKMNEIMKNNQNSIENNNKISYN